MIRRYDAVNNFFFIDPPYYDPNTKDGRTLLYEHALTKKDFKVLAATCATIKGKFLMTINDHEYIRECFRRFNINPISHIYNSVKSKQTEYRVTELLISNYPVRIKTYPLRRR